MYAHIDIRRKHIFKSTNDKTIEKTNKRSKSNQRIHTCHSRFEKSSKCYDIVFSYDEQHICCHDRKHMMPQLLYPSRHLRKPSLFPSNIHDHIDDTEHNKWNDDLNIFFHHLEFLLFFLFRLIDSQMLGMFISAHSRVIYHRVIMI